VEKRLIVFFVLTAVILFASQKLLTPKRPPTPPAEPVREAVSPAPEAEPETFVREPESVQETRAPAPMGTETAETIQIETEDVRVVLSNRGAAIVETELKAFEDPNGGPVRLVQGGAAPVALLRAGADTISLADTVFGWSKRSLTTAGVPETVVEFACSLAGGGQLVRRYHFPTTGYVFTVEQVLAGVDVDSSAIAWSAPLLTTEKNVKDDRGYFSVTGRSPAGVRKVKLSKLRKTTSKPVEGRDFSWLAARTKYFLAAVIPSGYSLTRAVAHGTPQNDGMTFVAWSPGDPGSFSLYLGPMSPSHLRELGVGLEVVAEFGASPLRPISRLMLSYITKLHEHVPNYGLVIILLSLTIKILFYPLTHKSFESMKKMQQLQPLINDLREKHKKNPQALQKATMELYKEHKVSPLGGCLPMLLQMPVFFALYPLLRGTIELRGAAFVGWIQDLSVPDPYYILPVVMGVAMFVQQKMSTADKRQAAMLYIMPVFLTYIFLRLPAGLVLYWLVFNVLSIAQQALMKGKIQTPSAATAAPKGSSGRSRKRGSGSPRRG
jgi:YidC/Oxa1 family membrane protein insertase